ncbi:hypothetical protein EN802_13870 [bacterium M00.F.Ca.ET.159.01.1.1]|nr:hypothetical protein EN802_13870 [bacterium M00.F.Ca.ET.159.01.1.1]
MKAKMAQSIAIYLCENCASVYIGFYRNGQLFAEAIPNDIDTLAQELAAQIAESKARQGITNTPVIAHKH